MAVLSRFLACLGVPLIFVSLVLGLEWLATVSSAAQSDAQESTQPQRLSPQEGARQGAALVSNLLSETPQTSVTNQVLLRLEKDSDQEKDIRARFIVLAGADRSTNIYETLPGSALAESNTMRFIVVRAPGQTNQYSLSVPASAPAQPVSGNQAMRPFAGSEFWLTDLALDFLQWPNQVVTRKEMLKGQFCAVLQSTNPRPAHGAYARVLSWVAINRPGVAIVHAEAYDADDKLLKLFDPKKLEKVNGQWQLNEMRIRNRQTGSRTRIDLNPER